MLAIEWAAIVAASRFVSSFALSFETRPAGWFSLLGQVSTSSVLAASGGYFVSSMVQVVFDLTLDQREIFAVYTGERAINFSLLRACKPAMTTSRCHAATSSCTSLTLPASIMLPLTCTRWL